MSTPNTTETSATGGLGALAIITIVAGIGVILLTLCGNASMLLFPLMKNMPGMGPALEATERMMSDTRILAISLGYALCTIALWSAAIASGFGMFKLRPWGRRLAVRFAIGHLGMWVVYLPLNLFFVQPIVRSYTEGLPATPMTSSFAGILITNLVTFVIYNALPVVLLAILTRPGVAARFTQGV